MRPLTEDRDPYAVLEIPSSSTADEVTAAYRAQARRHHPDVSVAPDAEQRMAEINHAWTLLRDPAKRAAWDRAHGITPQVARRGAAASNGVPRQPVPPTPSTPPTPSAGGSRPPTTSGVPWPTAARPGTRPGTTGWRRGPNGEGAAGPPPGNPRGTIMPFGRHIGWSLGEIARVDPGYLAWLRDRREGAPYRGEIETLLAGYRQAAEQDAPAKKGRRRLR